MANKLHSHPRIGVDLMGSDTPPEQLIEAVIQLKEDDVSTQFVVFASPEVMNQIPQDVRVVACPETITVEDDPIIAIRRKKASSLCQGIRFLKEKNIDAFISAGNTGALLLAAKTTLSALPGIDRPALLTLLPTHQGELAVLDVGANLSLKPHHILQFAAMGVAYQKSRGIENPTVALLNIGAESIKGTSQMRQAYAKLETLNRDRPIFLGNIEGKTVFSGKIDVLVTDGLTGNIFLKTAEGAVAFVLKELEQRAMKENSSIKYEISSLREKLYSAEHSGAILCGVDGIVVKCHGDVTPGTLIASIKGALRLVKHQFLEKIIFNLQLM